jgi:hypothetical protein
MRFMMLMIPAVYQGKKGKKAPKDFTPSAEDVAKMTKYNEDLSKAGALILLDGLHPPVSGARVSFKDGNPVVNYGPFSGSRNVLGGYWMIRAGSREEAVEWAMRVPAKEGDVIEVRQVFETDEFSEETKKAGESAIVHEQVEKIKRSAACQEYGR